MTPPAPPTLAPSARGGQRRRTILKRSLATRVARAPFLVARRATRQPQLESCPPFVYETHELLLHTRQRRLRISGRLFVLHIPVREGWLCHPSVACMFDYLFYCFVQNSFPIHLYLFLLIPARCTAPFLFFSGQKISIFTLLYTPTSSPSLFSYILAIHTFPLSTSICTQRPASTYLLSVDDELVLFSLSHLNSIPAFDVLAGARGLYATLRPQRLS